VKGLSMLKRYQVLLSDWQGEYLKFASEKYDLSSSEILRIMICFTAIETAKLEHPEYKSKIQPRQFFKKTKEMMQHRIDETELHAYLSQLYFEARKAVEYRMEHSR
jgi:hypothetical protein